MYRAAPLVIAYLMVLVAANARQVNPPCEPFPTPNVTPPAGYVPPQTKPLPPDWVQIYFSRLQRKIYQYWKIPLNRSMKVVVVSFVINADGSFENIRLVRSLGIPEADTGALRAVQKASGFCKNVPPLVSESPEIRVTLTLEQKKHHGSNQDTAGQ